MKKIKVISMGHNSLTNQKHLPLIGTHIEYYKSQIYYPFNRPNNELIEIFISRGCKFLDIRHLFQYKIVFDPDNFFDLMCWFIKNYEYMTYSVLMILLPVEIDHLPQGEIEVWKDVRKLIPFIPVQFLAMRDLYLEMSNGDIDTETFIVLSKKLLRKYNLLDLLRFVEQTEDASTEEKLHYIWLNATHFCSQSFIK